MAAFLLPELLCFTVFSAHFPSSPGSSAVMRAGNESGVVRPSSPSSLREEDAARRDEGIRLKGKETDGGCYACY